MAILQGMIKIHGIIESIFEASVFMYFFKTPNNFLEEKRIYSYHPKAAAHFDEPAIPGEEAAQLFECD